MEKKEKEILLHNAKKMADAVVTVFGRNCEAVVHDLTELQHSLVYIAGSVTGRKIGAPATNLLVSKIKGSDDMVSDVNNYRTTTDDGRILKSSTIFIRDSKEQVVGAFCINFDTTEFFNAAQALSPFFNHEENTNGVSEETFAKSVEETIETFFNQAVIAIGKHPSTMSTDEKIHLVEHLENHGTFNLKGAVEKIAAMTGVTKFTIYNYLKKIRNED